MRELFTSSSFGIDAGSTRSGVASRRQTLQIVSGSAWITVEGDSRDYWLSEGDTFSVQPERLIVMEAGQDACLTATCTASKNRFGSAVTALVSGAWHTLRHLFADRRSGGAAHIQTGRGAYASTCCVG